MTNSESLFFNYDGYSIEYIPLEGTTDSNIIFVNGIADPVQNHLDILEGFRRLGYNVWAINMPGHGSSEIIPKNISWDIMIEIVDEFAKRFGEKKFVLSGFSMGGGVALRYAAKYPNRVEELTLLSPFCYKIGSIMEIVLGGMKFVVEFATNAINNPTKKPAPVKVLPLYYLNHYQNIITEPDFDMSKLAGLDIHVVGGDMDPIVQFEKVKEALQTIPGATFDSIPDLTHDIYYITEDVLGEIIQLMVKYLALNENSEVRFK